MSTARVVIKILLGIVVFLIPCLIPPGTWAQILQKNLERPAIVFQAPADYWDGVKIPEAVLGKKALEDIQVLTSPGFQGRRGGTNGETKTLRYLEKQVRDLNLRGFGEQGYLQIFEIPVMEERVINGRAHFRPKNNREFTTSANLLAGIPGQNPKKTLIISAHYDSLGVYNGVLHPGANDNASGVGCVLEVMRLLVAEALEGTRPEVNVVAVFWGAEEMGLLGSRHFVAHPSIPLSSIIGVINCDTLANGQTRNFILWSDQDNFLEKEIKSIASQKKARIVKASRNGHYSDEMSFADSTNIPAITILSNQWLVRNHTPRDDLNLINEEKLDLASQILYDLIKNIAY